MFSKPSKLALLLVGLLLTVVAAQETTKLKPPEGLELAKVRQQVRAPYEEKFRFALNNPKIATELVAALRADADKGQTKPDERFAILHEVTQLLRDAGDLPGALRVVDEMDKTFAIDAVARKVSLVKTSQPTALLSIPRSTVQTLSPLIEACIATDKYREAKELANLGVAAAKATEDRELIQQQVDIQADVDLIQKNFIMMTPVLATLKTNPADVGANFKYGRFQCLMKGDWDKGLPHLAACADATLRSMATRELVQTRQAIAMVEKGDAMWKFAEGQTGLARRRAYQRAVYWYQQALPELSAADKARLQPRLGDTGGPKFDFKPAGAWVRDTGIVFTLNADGTIDSTAAETSLYKRGRWAMEGPKLVLSFGPKSIQFEVTSNEALKEIVTTKRPEDPWLLRRKPG